MANQREVVADERERVANQREVVADERERVANQREGDADERERVANHGPTERLRRATEQSKWLAGETFRLASDGARLRVQAGEAATLMAEQADAVASFFERTASRGDAAFRLAVADVEREAARVSRENAARLLDLGSKYEQGEPVPRLPRRPA